VVPFWGAAEQFRMDQVPRCCFEDPTVVYFQDANNEVFHSQFATTHLDPFVG